ncbi:MAG: hypothetical protein ACI8W3_003111 [Myxococcota bacterium]|jgi:hypothetical protein
MQRETIALPDQSSLERAGLHTLRPGRFRRAVSLGYGIGFALFLFGLAHAPLLSTTSNPATDNALSHQ